jgi:hypothetical protein
LVNTLVKLAEQVAIAMLVKVCVANSQGEPEASRKRYAPITLIHKIALDQSQQALFLDLENLRQEKRE